MDDMVDLLPMTYRLKHPHDGSASPNQLGHGSADIEYSESGQTKIRSVPWFTGCSGPSPTKSQVEPVWSLWTRRAIHVEDLRAENSKLE